MARSSVLLAFMAVLLLSQGVMSQEVEAEGPAAEPEWEIETVHDFLHSYNASEYAEIFEWVGLENLIKDNSEALTFFIAKDDAIEWFGEDNPDKVAILGGENSEELFREIALFAVVNGSHNSVELLGHGHSHLETLSGQELTVYRESPSEFIHVFSPAGSVAHVVEGNVVFGNSIIHFIDGPLLPVIPGFFNATEWEDRK